MTATWKQQIDNEHLVHAGIVGQYPNGSTELEARLAGIVDPRDPSKMVGKLTPAAARSWNEMAAHALRDGILLLPMGPADSFRSLRVQQRIFADRYRETDQGNGSRVCSGKRWWKRKGVATAACPGTSNHGKGEAVDVAECSGARLAWLEQHARTYGWAWELDSEPWHIHYLLGDALPAALADDPAPAEEDEDMAFGPDQAQQLEDLHQHGVNEPQGGMFDWGTPGGDLNGIGLTPDGRLLQVLYAGGAYKVRTLSAGVASILAGPRVVGERVDVQVVLAKGGKVRWLTYDGQTSGLPSSHHLVPDGDGWHYIDLAA